MRTAGPASGADGVTVHVAGVRKSYGTGDTAVRALRGVDLQVRRGELVAVTGRSGAGKSTLLATIAGLLRPDAGQVVVAGVDVTASSDDELTALRRETVGVIYQHFALLPLLTAAENVGVPMRITRADPAHREQRVAELLERVGLGPHAAQRPDELSGGQQQRVAIARALSNRPQVLLADEPTAQLDTESGIRIMDLLADLVHRDGVSAVVATHDPLIEQMADSVLHLEDGVVAAPVRSDPA